MGRRANEGKRTNEGKIKSFGQAFSKGLREILSSTSSGKIGQRPDRSKFHSRTTRMKLAEPQLRRQPQPGAALLKSFRNTQSAAPERHSTVHTGNSERSERFSVPLAANCGSVNSLHTLKAEKQISKNGRPAKRTPVFCVLRRENQNCFSTQETIFEMLPALPLMKSPMHFAEA